MRLLFVLNDAVRAIAFVALGLPDADLRAIERDNALRLLPRFARKVA